MTRVSVVCGDALALRYFHGGKPGLVPGDYVLPSPTHFIDGCPICQAVKDGRATPFEQPNAEPDHVHVTTDREYARFYASKYIRGDLYVVEPEGELSLSRADHFPTWTCERARVVSVFAHFVELTPRQRTTLLRRWKRADDEAARKMAQP